MFLDIQIDQNFYEKFIPSTLSLIITGTATVFFGIWLEKFIRRTTYLKYKLSFQPFATSQQNTYWGNFQVHHNQRVVQHLSYVTLEIYNDSNTDLANVNLDVWVDARSQILATKGNFVGSGQVIPYEANYSAIHDDVGQRILIDQAAFALNPNHLTPQDLLDDVSYIMRNKKFSLFAFNRKTSISMDLLVENFDGRIPSLMPSILHQGVKLIVQEDQDKAKKRATIWTAIIGLSLFSIVFTILISKYPEATTPLVLCGIIGLVHGAVGYGIYTAFRFLKRAIW